jgi:transposase
MELDAAGLRRAACAARDASAARRMLALAMIMEGHSREDAARACGMDRQTLPDWVHRYNGEGLDGLRDRRAPGRSPLLTPEQGETLAGWVREGPDVKKDGLVRWRRIDLARKVEREFGVKLAERSMGTILNKLGFSHISARPRNPKGDADAQQAHKKTSQAWSMPRSLTMRAASR